MTKGRKIPDAVVDHTSALRDRLGFTAYIADPASTIPWQDLPKATKEYWRTVADSVMQAIVKPSQRSGSIGVASSYGAATKRPYVELTCDISPIQFSPAKAREIALLLLECADAAESDAVVIEFGRHVLDLDEQHAAQLLEQFRRFREFRRGKEVDVA